MRAILTISAAGLFAFGAALAQQSVEPTDHDQHGADSEPPVAAASELDALSQGGEDEFPDFEKAQIRKPVSVTVRALDKITARYKDLNVKIGESVRFGALEIVPRHCDKRPPEEFPETTAFLEVFDRDVSRSRSSGAVDIAPLGNDKDAKDKTVRKLEPAAASAPEVDLPASLDPDRIFAGWMFASTPALNALEHSVYDVWVIDCKTVVVES